MDFNAHELAQDYHEGQTYGKHDYYAYHLVGVAHMVKDFSDDPDAVTAAILHDILEDTDCTASVLAYNGIPTRVIEAVVLLTKTKGYDKDEYLDRIARNPLAKAVKMADSTFNLKNSLKSGSRKRVAKYCYYLTRLVQ